MRVLQSLLPVRRLFLALSLTLSFNSHAIAQELFGTKELSNEQLEASRKALGLKENEPIRE